MSIYAMLLLLLLRVFFSLVECILIQERKILKNNNQRMKEELEIRKHVHENIDDEKPYTQ